MKLSIVLLALLVDLPTLGGKRKEDMTVQIASGMKVSAQSHHPVPSKPQLVRWLLHSTCALIQPKPYQLHPVTKHSSQPWTEITLWFHCHLPHTAHSTFIMLTKTLLKVKNRNKTKLMISTYKVSLEQVLLMVTMITKTTVMLSILDHSKVQLVWKLNSLNQLCWRKMLAIGMGSILSFNQKNPSHSSWWTLNHLAQLSLFSTHGVLKSNLSDIKLLK